MPKKKRWRYFSYKTDPKIAGLQDWFIDIADRIRHVAMIPMVITSGLRKTKTGSSHEKGIAMDVRSRSWRSHYRFLFGSIHYGIKRIGVYVKPIKCPSCGLKIKDIKLSPTHVHLDKDDSKDQEVLWIGISK